MKIAVLTSGVLPVPAIQGGAVENLVDLYLEYNERLHLHDITVYSIWHPEVRRSTSNDQRSTSYIYIKGYSLRAKLWKAVGRMTRSKDFYHDSIEYYLHEALETKWQHQTFITIK